MQVLCLDARCQKDVTKNQQDKVQYQRLLFIVTLWML